MQYLGKNINTSLNINTELLALLIGLGNIWLFFFGPLEGGRANRGL